MGRNRNSDTAFSSEKHAELVSSILTLNKRPELQKPSRTEPTLQISEFSLIKSGRGKHGTVLPNDLTKALKKKAKHVKIGKQIQSAGQKAQTLPKPLAKPKAERIRRITAFKGVRKELDRWDAVVTSNRAKNHLSFPLSSNMKLKPSKNFTGFRLKTDLQKRLEALEPKVEVFNLEKESEYPLTMQEILERRKEMAKMRAVESYKAAKARKQNKIKSKKYHRIQRREKIKQQMKEFEQLQKTNPEEALKKLEEIERVRAEERASLRHRSTSKWAKSKQVRAKYDKDSRQALAQQLAVSRELTQKVKANPDSDSDEEVATKSAPSTSGECNPWTNPIKTSKEVTDFISGYRKFWEDKNNIANKNDNSNVLTKPELHLSSKDEKKDIGTAQKPNQSNVETKIVLSENRNSENQQEIHSKLEHPNTKNQSKTNVKLQNNVNSKLASLNTNKSLKSQKKSQGTVKSKYINDEYKSLEIQLNKSKVKLKRVTKDKEKSLGTTEWSVNIQSDDSDNEEINNMFDKFDDKLQKRLQVRYKKLKREFEQEKNIKLKTAKVKNKKPQKRKSKVDLSLPLSTTHPIIDEELIETAGTTEHSQNKDLSVLNDILNARVPDENSCAKGIVTVNNIDPNNIMKTKPVNLNTEIPDLLTLEENEEDVDQRGTISEAFQDDDIVDEFHKDKQAEIDKEKPKEVDLNLPGWGSWAGPDIDSSRPKKNTFIMKFPQQLPRRDDSKGNLFINEKAKKKIKPYLVSEVPFPFKTVKDFEASIRAPIGNTFVPETAFRRMIRPAVTTKMGTIIEPMSDDILLKKKK